MMVKFKNGTMDGKEMEIDFEKIPISFREDGIIPIMLGFDPENPSPKIKVLKYHFDSASQTATLSAPI